MFLCHMMVSISFLCPLSQNALCQMFCNKEQDVDGKTFGSFSRGAVCMSAEIQRHGLLFETLAACTLCLKRVSVIWVQAEIALLRRAATVYPVSREVGRGPGTVFHFMWVVHPHWNTMAAPDTAHSHTVLPHWKSHKTQVIGTLGLWMMCSEISGFSHVTLLLLFLCLSIILPSASSFKEQ